MTKFLIFPHCDLKLNKWKRTNSALSWYLVFSSELNWDHSLANFLEISAKDMSGVSFRTVSRRSFRKWTYPDNGCFGAPGLLGYLFFPFGHPLFLTSLLKKKQYLFVTMYFAIYEDKSYVDDDDLVESLDSSLTFSETGVELIMPKSLSSRGVTSRCVDNEMIKIL